MSEDDLRGLAHDDEALEFLRTLGMRSAITVALQARGEVTGTLTIAVAWSGRRYRREDARFAWILSGRVALALDNSGLFADLERAGGPLGDRRDPAARPAALAAAAHPRLVGCSDVQAGGRRERSRRGFL